MAQVLKLALATALVASVGLAGCNDREASTRSDVVPATSPTAKADLPPEIQKVDVAIADGKFQADTYAVQTGATRLIVSTQGGPYAVSIDRLMEPQVVPANTTAELHLNIVNPGDYTLKLSGPSEDTAVLNVRPLGGR